MLVLLLSFLTMVLAQKELKIEELGTDNWGELVAFNYHSFFRIFGAYLPTGGQMFFVGVVVFGILYMSAKKKHSKGGHSSSPDRKRSSSHNR